MKTILVAGALAMSVLGSGVAEARTWWSIDASKATCSHAEVSPDQMIQYMRSSKEFRGPPDVKTFPEESREVKGVMVTGTYTTGNSTSLFFFDTRQYCENVLDRAKTEGLIHDRSQLQ